MSTDDRERGVIHPIGHFAARAVNRAKQRNIEAVSQRRLHATRRNDGALNDTARSRQSADHSTSISLDQSADPPVIIVRPETNHSIDSNDQMSQSTDPSNNVIEPAAYQSPPVSTSFDLSVDQEQLIAAISGLSEAGTLTSTQASLVRMSVAHNDQSIIQCVTPLLSRPSDQIVISDIIRQSNDLRAIELECATLQNEELEVLSSIFPDELSIARALPLIVTILVKLESVECQLEINCMVDSLYPLKHAASVRSFIPPPFNDLFVGKNTDDKPSLQQCLEQHAYAMIGECSIYSLIEAARSWVDEQLPVLQESLEMRESARAEEQKHRALYQSINQTPAGDFQVDIFGRGRIESEIESLIVSASGRLNCSRAQAMVSLLEAKWDLSKLQPLTSVHSSSSDIENLVAAMQHTDHDVMLTCISCMEDFCGREGVRLMDCCVLGHFACYACYARYLITILNTGSAFIRCPGTVTDKNKMKPCWVFVEQGIICALLSVHDFQRYRRFLQDSFITLQQARWCVNPRCNYVARIRSNSCASVVCHCNAVFCIACGEAGHWPLRCGERSLYYSSLAIQGFRAKHEQIAKLEREMQDDLLVISVKPCPSCKTKWERMEGCNHIKCGKCGHHYCFVCLGNWATHGVAWYECMFAHREVKATNVVFHESDALSGTDDEVLLTLVGRECEASNNMSRAIKVKANAEGELTALLKEVDGSTIDDLNSLLTTVIASHALLQHVFIQLCQYKGQLSGNKISPLAKKMFEQLGQTEFFIDIIDSALLRFDLVRGVRQERSLKQLQDTQRSIVKYGTLFIQSLKQFLEKEAKAPVFEEDDKDEDEPNVKADNKQSTTAAFYTHLDRRTGKAGRKDDAKFDIVPPLTF